MEQSELEELVNNLVEKQDQLDETIKKKDAEIETLKESNKELMTKLMVKLESSHLPERELTSDEIYNNSINEIANSIREKYINME